MNFNTLTHMPVAAALEELRDTTAPEWDACTLRQSFQGSAHVDTKCIPLRGALSFADSYDPAIYRIRYGCTDKLPSTIALINAVLGGLPVKTVGNVLAVALLPGGYIRPHMDQGSYAEHFDRLHIVLSSPRGSWFMCDGEVHNPEPGEVFMFNHHALHSAGNPSEEARIHLIVDLTFKD